MSEELDLETRIEMAVIGLATINKMIFDLQIKIKEFEERFIDEQN